MSKGDSKRPRDGGVSKKQYDSNFEAVFGKKEIKTWNPEEDYNPFWEPYPRADGRIEWKCPHGVGHGNHIHGCDECCYRKDYPGRRRRKNEGGS